jgi:hypothetical protein
MITRELKNQIRRKANRHWRKLHDRTPAQFLQFDVKNRGCFLQEFKPGA